VFVVARFELVVAILPEREVISAVLVAMFPVAVARFELVVLRLVFVVAILPERVL
jgi:hypothetical protein